MPEIPINIKAPIFLNLDIGNSKNNVSHCQSGCSIFDVYFLNDDIHNISTLSFKNYFTSYITIKFRSRNKVNIEIIFYN